MRQAKNSVKSEKLNSNAKTRFTAQTVPNKRKRTKVNVHPSLEDTEWANVYSPESGHCLAL